MKILYTFLCLALLTTTNSCKSNKDAVQDKTQMKRISFGSGGGFAGAFTEYCLYESGLIEIKDDINARFRSHTSIEKSVCEQLFSSIESLNLENKQINDPGNLYYFVKIADGDKKVDFNWGGMNQKVDPAVKKYYDLLIGLAERKAAVAE